MSEPQNFISVDASTNSMAFAYFEDGSLAKYGKVKHKSKEYESIKDMLYAKLNEKK